MAEQLLELEDGLQIYRIPMTELREQDVNARNQDKTMFERLTATIKRDGRLESLPFVAKTAKGFEIVSGHHRVRAAIAAQHPAVICLVDVTGLTEDQIKAKQLAHNSIQGKDNAQLVAQIFKEIKDAEAKLEAFVDQSVDAPLVKVQIEDVNITMDFRMVSIVFLPTEAARWKAVAEQIKGLQQELWLAEMAHFEPFQKLAKGISAEYEIRAMGTILSKVGELALQAMGQGVQDGERISLRDLFRTAYVPKEAGQVIRKALMAMQTDGVITEKNLWQALEYLCADYLAGAKTPS